MPLAVDACPLHLLQHAPILHGIRHSFVAFPSVPNDCPVLEHGPTCGLLLRTPPKLHESVRIDRVDADAAVDAAVCDDDRAAVCGQPGAHRTMSLRSEVQPMKGWLKVQSLLRARNASSISGDGLSRLKTVATGGGTPHVPVAREAKSSTRARASGSAAATSSVSHRPHAYLVAVTETDVKFDILHVPKDTSKLASKRRQITRAVEGTIYHVLNTTPSVTE